MYPEVMAQVGTWLVLVGAGLSVLQAVWVMASTGRRLAKLRADRAASVRREKLLEAITEELRSGWGDEAADIGNYEETEGYRPSPELDRLRAKQAELREQRAQDDWILTYAALGRAKAPNERELETYETEWRRLWTQGIPGLVGGVMALVGGLLSAFAASTAGLSLRVLSDIFIPGLSFTVELWIHP